MIWYLIKARQIFDKYSRDEMSVYAAQASFFIILAAFPFLMLLLSLIRLLPMVGEADLLRLIVRAVPGNLTGLVLSVIDSIYTGASIPLLSVSAAAALWSASRGILSIERGLNRANGITVRRSYLLRRLICAGYTVLFTLMCVLCLGLLVFGNALQERLCALLPRFAPAGILLTPARALAAIFILFLFFLALYTLLPDQKQALRLQIPGALLSAVGWFAFSMAYSFYFQYFDALTITYGSLTAAILLMLWLYFNICILFAGAELNHFLETQP